ncbi:MAG: hypothetical protein KGH69_03795 [Candidatus Micrarchaeota archaeon]|nr:hypothetical protein [Candidatus Micrarchaeota archaeon]
MLKFQSAMEYLMTYGWAILAIAIVMVSLYSLGIFNSGSLQPVAAPGSCEVVRTAAQTSLAGQCSNLIPKYIGQFNGNAQVAVSWAQAGSAYTFTFWEYDNMQSCVSPTVIMSIWQSGGFHGSTMGVKDCPSPSFIFKNVTSYGNYGQLTPIVFRAWEFVSVNLNNTNGNANITVINSSGTYSTVQTFGGNGNLFYTPSTVVDIGGGNGGSLWTGYLANIQVYNVSLDKASLTSLYNEGIGGAPINPQKTVAWWPLNGNMNDYSGNNYQGVNTIGGGAVQPVVWNANWQSTYTGPT